MLNFVFTLYNLVVGEVFFMKTRILKKAEAKKFLEEQREKFFSNDASLEKAEGLKPE